MDKIKSLLKKFKEWIKSRLIPEAKQWYKFWSTQLVALGTAIVGFAPEIQTWLAYFMTQFSLLPRSVQHAFDASIIQFVGMGVILLSIPAKLFKQKNVDGE